MKKQAFLFSLLLWLLSCSLGAQNAWYVSTASGLNLRSTPGTSGQALVKIPFGAKVDLLPGGELTPYESEEVDSYWQRVSYDGKTGYVVHAFINRIAPPKATETLEEYLKRTAVKAGTLHYSSVSGAEEISGELSYSSDKTFYANNIVLETRVGYEWYENRLVIEDMSAAQAFIFIRGLQKEFGDVIAAGDNYPKAGSTYTRTLKREGATESFDAEYTVTAVMSDCSENAWPLGIRIEHSAYGAFGYLEIRYEYNYVQIIWGSAV